MKLVLSGCLLVALSTLVAGCHSGDAAKPALTETVSARVVESQLQQAPVTVRATGSLHARESAVISAQVVGRIQQLMVREGDTVREGQILVLLDDSTIRASADQASAGLMAAQSQQAAAQTEATLAASTLERYKQLESQKSVSPQEMDEITRRSEASAERVDIVRAQTEAAKAQEREARAMLGYTRLRAPFAGVVTARMADPGTLASPGVPLLQIDQAGPLQLQANIDESVISAVRIGMKIQVNVDSAPSAAELGTVAQIVPAADLSSHSFLVKIDLPLSKQLRAGMYGTAEIPQGSRQAILVANSAIVVRGSLPCAYVLDNGGIAQLRYVTLGAAQGQLIEILSGISAGEKLVDNPADRDFAGRRIEVQP